MRFITVTTANNKKTLVNASRIVRVYVDSSRNGQATLVVDGLAWHLDVAESLWELEAILNG